MSPTAPSVPISTPSYKRCASIMVRFTLRRNFREDSCCNVEVMKGATALRFFSRLLRIHQIDVYLAGRFEGLLDGLLGDLVEHDPVDLRAQIGLSLEFLLQVVADGFPLAVRVGGQVHFRHFLGSLFQLGNELLLT